MPFYWGDYFKKTLHLSCEDHGAYMLLIGAYWERGKALPDDDRFFASVTKLSLKKWKMVRPKIAEFFDISEGLWRHERVEIELLRSNERIASARTAGIASAATRGQPPTITKNKIVDLRGFVVGKGNGKTEHTPENRLTLFQIWLEKHLGPHGAVILAEAADPSRPGYAQAVAHCKKVARENGKGWPLQWPK